MIDSYMVAKEAVDRGSYVDIMGLRSDTKDYTVFSFGLDKRKNQLRRL